MRVQDQGAELPYALRVLPVNPQGADEPSFLVLFETTALPWTATTPPSQTGADSGVEWLRRELASSKQYAQTVVDQHDMVTQDLCAAHLPMVTVGRDLCVRRLTPAAGKAFNLLPSDVGRSIDHIKFAVTIDDIAASIENVVATLPPWQQEARDRNGR